MINPQDINVTELAAIAEMTTANWYAIESEEIKSLPVETLRRIEKTLGVDFNIHFEAT